jgi:hypothetical protein
MALSDRKSKPLWHLLVGLAGLTGLAAAGVGLFVYLALAEEAGLYVLLGGGALALPALVAVLVQGARLVTSRRGAVGTNVALQVLLAAGLLVGVNLFSFYHHRRWDLTEEQKFTIEESVREQLARARGDTTIVLHLRHVTFGQTKEHKRDAYDAEAERKVQEKVKDLVEQFQELGPKFKVVTLDVEDLDYNKRLKDLTEGAPALRKAIEESTDNRIFFRSGDKVQSLSFSQLYRLDRDASTKANGGKGNLVLRPQGVEPFARRILNIDERHPRLAVAVIHPVLGLESDREVMQMRGLKKVLEARGYTGKDLIVKKPNELTGTWDPAAMTYEDSRYEELEDEVAELDQDIKTQQRVVEATAAKVKPALKFWEGPLEEINRKYAVVELGEGRPDVLVPLEDAEDARREKLKVLPVADHHRKEIARRLHATLEREEAALAQRRTERAAKAREMAGLDTENLQEQRRVTDVPARLKRMLSEVDLLVVPRFTLYKIPQRDLIPPWLHGLEREQVQAIKEFLKAGKPVLFCLGPANEDPLGARGRRPPGTKPDELEPLLEDLGFHLPNQTILFDSESRPAPERRRDFLTRIPEVTVPPMAFDWTEPLDRPEWFKKALKVRPPGRLRTSLRLSLPGAEQDAELRLRHPRPVYFVPPAGTKLATDPVFMVTDRASWNESQPYPTAKRVPRYEPPGEKDPDKGTERERQRGPLPVGVAAEVRLRRDWYPDPAKANPPTVRVAVIGHGAVFSGETLSPAREQLFLDVSNWLLGRDELLARESQPWQYPRVQLDPTEERLWKWAMLPGLPLLFIYLGCMMWLVRRMR